LSKRDAEIISQYLTGDDAAVMLELVEADGGIDRVEGDHFIMSNGTPVCIQPKSLHERWAEEEECRPADWLSVHS